MKKIIVLLLFTAFVSFCLSASDAFAWTAYNGGNDIPVPETILINGGKTMIGHEAGEVNEKPAHEVSISSFYMGKYEVTNLQFCYFLNEKGNMKEGGVEWIDLAGTWDDTSQKCHIYFSDNIFKVENSYENYPVTFVSWYGAVAYCNWLTEKTGQKFRLPTEAEWEYVAKSGGKDLNFVWGNEPPLGKYPGNFADESLRSIYPDMRIAKAYNDGYAFLAPVGMFEPNELGIYDLAGNVWEWCSNWFSHGYRVSDGTVNPKGPANGTMKTTRGGSWLDGPMNLRVARRVGIEQTARSLNLGFRVVMEVE